MDTWSSCRSSGLDLEIVVVYRPTIDHPDRFIEFCNDMFRDLNIWLLPFDDSVTRMLFQATGGDHALYPERLIMVGPNGNFLERDGLNILLSSNSAPSNAYPYAFSVLVDEETERLQRLSLTSLLVLSEGTNFVLNNNGEHILIDSLIGTDILVYFIRVPDRVDDGIAQFSLGYDVEDNLAFIRSIKELCDFEVIFVLLHTDFGEPDADWFSQLPGLSCPINRDRENHIMKTLYPRGTREHDTMVAYDSDGQMVSFDATWILKHNGANVFPIPNDSLADDIKQLYRRLFSLSS